MMLPLPLWSQLVTRTRLRCAKNRNVGTLVFIQRNQLSCLKSPLVSITKFTLQREADVPTERTFDIDNKCDISQKLDYISLYFQRHDLPRRGGSVAWTFSFPEGSDLRAVLMTYAKSMEKEKADDHVRAFEAWVARPGTKALLLPWSRRTEEIIEADIAGLEHKNGSHKKSKRCLLPSCLPRRARHEELMVRLQQGETIMEVASHFGKTPVFIAREYDRLYGEYSYMEKCHFMHHLPPYRRGNWSDGEIVSLVILRNEALALQRMSSWLRRSEKSMKKKLAELAIAEIQMEEGPQELPPGLRDSLFDNRLNAILRGLIHSPMTPTWKEIISGKSVEEWASCISSGVPRSVRDALGGLTGPTYKKLEDISSVCTTEHAGVYARLMRRSFDIGRQNRWVYVGSATRFGGGLRLRISEHTDRNHRAKNPTNLQQLIKRKRLRNAKTFVTLMTVEIASPEKTLEVRRLAILAEAVMTIWLGALISPLIIPHHRQLYVWGPEMFDYIGASSHNPLELDLRKPKDDENKELEGPSASASS